MHTYVAQLLSQPRSHAIWFDLEAVVLNTEYTQQERLAAYNAISDIVGEPHTQDWNEVLEYIEECKHNAAG